MNNNLNIISEVDQIKIANAISCDIDDVLDTLQIKEKDLIIVTQNIRSAYFNFNDFLISLAQLNFDPDIIILSECWLCEYKPTPIIPNYKSYSSSRYFNRSDGVIVYIRDRHDAKVNEIQLLDASSIQIQINKNTIIAIYRSPSISNIDRFLDSLNKHLETLGSQTQIVIAGDININILPREDEPRSTLADAIAKSDTVSPITDLSTFSQPSSFVLFDTDEEEVHTTLMNLKTNSAPGWDNVPTSLDNKNKCLAVFLDLKKAFDTVSLPILEQKLELAGVRGTPLELFKSYLNGRTQRIFSYADDTAVVFTGDSWSCVKSHAEQALTKIAKWLNANLLTLNTSKTNFMCFSIYDRYQPDTPFEIKIHQCDRASNLICKCPAISKCESDSRTKGPVPFSLKKEKNMFVYFSSTYLFRNIHIYMMVCYAAHTIRRREEDNIVSTVE
ncbi:hypothetical protein ABMA28_001359 [Loxostege sticticalis]|uniref:Reverse transcriptase domain-containing protein n=1 Tax=Loxostege sticticalis TaxID=481309 RepID=A0ABD0T1E5_LOXSC